MAYLVKLTPRAEQDLDRIYARVTRKAPYRGPQWFDRFEQSILSLSNFPERCTIVPNLSSAERTVRQLLFGRRRYVYRIYFAIFADVVSVLHVRHGARKELRRL
jgi:plasmid stabilization system protein ParE